MGNGKPLTRKALERITQLRTDTDRCQVAYVRALREHAKHEASDDALETALKNWIAAEHEYRGVVDSVLFRA